MKSHQRSCSNCDSREKGLFCSLNDQELRSIEQVKFVEKFKSGQYLFYSGNSASGIYCLVKGTVKLESQDENGKSQIVQIYKSGSLIGYRALFSNEPYLGSAIAVDEVEVCFIPKISILELVKSSPELALKFLSHLSHDFRMMEIRLQHSVSHSAVERIAEALLFLRENFEKNWTRKEIAEWAGTTPETVMRTLADFEEDGLIEQKGREILIKDRTRLLEKSNITV